MKFEIRRVKNGCILEVTASEIDGPEEVVFQESEANEVQTFALFMRYLVDEYGPSTSRYSAERIYVDVRPGDRHEDGKD